MRSGGSPPDVPLPPTLSGGKPLVAPARGPVFALPEGGRSKSQSAGGTGGREWDRGESDEETLPSAGQPR